ncbi:allophanate hydrolase subunit 1 [Grimontia hollisae]|uniref:Allophanate hydrolase subunit 1 n=1 Tax=Grimontia hollisae CIP 101886 TaxID=675812 RepID=D0I9M0_GRIHO|nr:5-oxoprolinase subunit PxpB [Grimontia hollisae]AMG29044.1 allophanate hydrolase subunit 1 [Grimontia hollisae]EEY71735.1 allophanate hydrolase subunit 1 [Grimontia hollisae CIP 101886]STO77006.1 Sporulation inhibitor kipI [Grimontia hollisae]
MARIESVNEQTLIVYFGDNIDETVAADVNRAIFQVRESLGDLVTDMIPSYNSMLVGFDLNRTDRFDIIKRIRLSLASTTSEINDRSDNQVVEIPVYYGEEVALDMPDVCEKTGLDSASVIKLHSQREYRVYAIGFSPGFAYLGSLDDAIVVPRKSTPRLKVPTGSVGLADNQTAIYPSSTPGGWQIIGRTPLNMVDWDSDSLAKVNVGNRVKFCPIDREEFLKQGGVL